MKDALTPVVQETPESTQLARLEKTRGSTRVHLPEAYALEAIKAFLSDHWIQFEVIPIPEGRLRQRPALQDEAWCFCFLDTEDYLLERVFPSKKLLSLKHEGRTCLGAVFLKNTLEVKTRKAQRLQRALERVKPTELDTRGLPTPWVSLRQRIDPLLTAEKETGEVIRFHTSGQEASWKVPAIEDTTFQQAEAQVQEQSIREAFQRIREHLQFPETPLILRRSGSNKQGFVTGRIWLTHDDHPLRIVLTLCPNADLADCLATLIHEIAHCLSKSTAHDITFKKTLVDLCKSLYGDDFFDGCLKHLESSYRTVDLWVIQGIRASLKNEPVPVEKQPHTLEQGHMLKVVGRIQKLRALAADRPGSHEGISATIHANRLIAMYGLGDVQIRSEWEDEEQMVDRWIDVGKRQPWRRSLVDSIAEYCNVFALTSSLWPNGMHLFGRYRDVVAVEYLIGVCAEQIERECARHIKAWRKEHPELKGGPVRREGISFRDSAVLAIEHKIRESQKLGREAVENEPHSELARGHLLATRDFKLAEAFARDEHHKRGSSWTTGYGKVTEHNAEGYEAGRAVSLRGGIQGGSRVKGLLSS